MCRPLFRVLIWVWVRNLLFAFENCTCSPVKFIYFIPAHTQHIIMSDHIRPHWMINDFFFPEHHFKGIIDHTVCGHHPVWSLTLPYLTSPYLSSCTNNQGLMIFMQLELSYISFKTPELEFFSYVIVYRIQFQNLEMLLRRLPWYLLQVLLAQENMGHHGCTLFHLLRRIIVCSELTVIGNQILMFQFLCCAKNLVHFFICIQLWIPLKFL